VEGFREGETVMEEGEHGMKFYIILTGLVSVLILNNDLTALL